MRILHVVPTYYPAVRYGGPIYAVHGLARGLAARGHYVEVFTTNVDGIGRSDVPLGRPVVLDDVKISYFACNSLRRLYWSPDLGRALTRDLKHFDIVHLHSVFLWPTWAAARAAERAHVPYVVSPHGMLVRELIRRRNRIAKTAWIRMIERRSLEKAAAIHVSSGLESEELYRFGWKLPPIAKIYYGVEVPPNKPLGTLSDDVKSVSRRQPFMLFLGRISWKKGLERLLEAFARLKTGDLVIAGTDDEGLSPRLGKQAKTLGISDRVSILPRTIEGRDKEHLLAAARGFVLPSYSENYGISVLEAMWRGLPVVVTPEVGAAEIVREARAGAIVSGDANSLSKALNSLMLDSNLALRTGEAGRAYVQKRHNWTATSRKIEGLYRSLVDDVKG